MPTYEFTCEKCGHTDEDFRAISKRDEPMKCSKCKGLMTRLISATKNYILKGEGFYETTYKKDKEE